MVHKAELGSTPPDKNALFLYLAPNYWAFQKNTLLIYKFTSVVTDNQVTDVRYSLI